MDGKKKKTHSTCRDEEPHRQSNGPVFIPVDVWAEILLRIPAEDLVKLKVVCKGWYELITSPSFARSHLDHWTTSRPPFSGFAVHTYCDIDGGSNSSILYFTGHLGRGQEQEGRFQCRDYLIKYCHLLSMDIRLLASCDGLLLIGYAKEDRYQLVICNPITGTYRKLPIFQPSDRRFSVLLSESISEDYEWALARNSSNGQYKVFGMQTHPNPRRTCQVFELKRDGCEENSGHNWKELDAPLPMEWLVESSTATEGRVHWFACGGVPPQVKVLSIDVLTDEFRTSASIELLPGTDLCRRCSWTYFCTQPWNHDGSRVWVLENFDKPRWVEKSRIVCHQAPWFLRLTEPFIMPGGVMLVISNNSNYDVTLEAPDTDTASSNCSIRWNAEKVVPHVNSLIGFS